RRQTFVRMAHGLPGAVVPEEHRPATVLPLRDHSLEGPVFDRMVLGADRETLLGRVETGTFGHRPAEKHPVELETKVVVQTRRGMLLAAERFALPAGRGRSAGLRRHREVAFATVLAQPGRRPPAGGLARSNGRGGGHHVHLGSGSPGSRIVSSGTIDVTG